MKKSLVLLAIIAIVAMAGCTKEGPTGPAGPQGPQGAQGNANVYTSQYTVSSWGYQSPKYYADLTNWDITQSIVDWGAVITYINGANGWEALPLTEYYQAPTYSKTYTAVHDVWNVRIWITDSDLTQPFNPGTRYFKVVVIAGMRIADIPIDVIADYDSLIKFCESK